MAYQQQQQEAYPLSASLQQQFIELSKNRDTASESVTEEKFIPTEDGGFIHEVTSRTTPRRRPDTGEAVSTVTQRRVATVGHPEGHNTTPPSTLSLKYATKSVGSSRSPSTNSYSNSNYNNNMQQQTQYQQNNTYNNNNNGVSPGPTSYDFNGGAEGNNNNSNSRSINFNNNNNNNQPIPSQNNNNGGNWRYNNNDVNANNNNNNTNFRNEPTYYDQQQMNSMVPPTPPHIRAARNVKIGGVSTNIVEPFRISPLNPERNYAPLKYVTRRQLREMQQRGNHRNLINKMRTSSVPHLDELLIQEQQQNYNYSTIAQDGGAGEYPPQEDFGPRTFTGEPDTRMFYNNNNNNNQHRSISQHSNASSGVRPYYDSQYGNNNNNYGSPSSVTTVGSLPAVDGDDMVRRFAFAIRRINGIGRRHFSEAPAYCGAAMRLLMRGTYLIHYGYEPHERYFMLRMLKDPIGRLHPYFVWSLHNESASYIDKIHLAHLIGVGRGTSSGRFPQFTIDSRRLVGPFVGDEPSKVSNKFAFTFVFESEHARRRVDVLALDDQTYRCWLLVCDYFADINCVARRLKAEAVESGQEFDGGMDQDEDANGDAFGGDMYGGAAESMAPDTPRSHASSVNGGY